MPKIEKNTEAKRRAIAKPEKTDDEFTPETNEEIAKERFIKDVLTRGEAADLTEEGKLPPEATHVIKENADGTVEIKRSRYKAF